MEGLPSHGGSAAMRLLVAATNSYRTSSSWAPIPLKISETGSLSRSGGRNKSRRLGFPTPTTGVPTSLLLNGWYFCPSLNRMVFRLRRALKQDLGLDSRSSNPKFTSLDRSTSTKESRKSRQPEWVATVSNASLWPRRGPARRNRKGKEEDLDCLSGSAASAR